MCQVKYKNGNAKIEVFASRDLWDTLKKQSLIETVITQLWLKKFKENVIHPQQSSESTDKNNGTKDKHSSPPSRRTSETCFDFSG